MKNTKLNKKVDKNISLLVLTDFLMTMGFQGTYFVGIIGCATYVLHADAFAVSALVFVFNVLFVASLGIAGVLVDALGPRRTLIGSVIAMAIAGICGVLLPVSYFSLGAFTLIDSLAAGISSCSIDTFPRYLVENTGRLQRINSLNNLAVNLAIIGGPALGAVITHVFSSQYVFAIMIVASIGGLIAITGLHEQLHPQKDTKANKQSTWENFRDGFLITFKSSYLRLLFFLGFFGFFAYGAFDSLESLFYRDTLHASAEWMGWLNSIAGLGGFLGSLIVMKVKGQHLSRHFLSLLLLITGIGSMIYVGTSSVWIAAIGQLITGMGFGAMGPVRITLTQKHCAISHVGRVTAVMRMGMNIAGTAPLLVAPLLANLWGVQPVLFGASCLVALIATVFMMLTHKGEH